jgi:Lar family restriction alleviation protein
MASEELKPCPFCGSTDVSIEVRGDRHLRVLCCSCAAKGPHVYFVRVEAIAAWNRRAEVTHE